MLHSFLIIVKIELLIRVLNIGTENTKPKLFHSELGKKQTFNLNVKQLSHTLSEQHKHTEVTGSGDRGMT